MFHVGQMVVCINGDFVDKCWRMVPHMPVKSRIYVLRGVVLGWYRPHGVYLVVEELINPAIKWSDGTTSEPHFLAARFRPVRTTDISIFRKMVEKLPESVE